MKIKTLLCLYLFFLCNSYARELSIYDITPEIVAAKRQRLFECRNFGSRSTVNELYIVEATLGKKTTYEVEVPYYSQLGEQETYTRKLNLIEKYNGKVLLFTTGNYRVKIDRAIPVEMKYKTFVRLPYFDIHSTQWFCKDY